MKFKYDFEEDDDEMGYDEAMANLGELVELANSLVDINAKVAQTTPSPVLKEAILLAEDTLLEAMRAASRDVGDILKGTTTSA